MCVAEQGARLTAASEMYAAGNRPSFLDGSVRRREEVLILQSIRRVHRRRGRTLHVATIHGERHTITYRLKDLEARLDPARFLRLGRGTLANIDVITKVNVMPGGTYVAVLSTSQKLQISRLQSRILRERFLRL